MNDKEFLKLFELDCKYYDIEQKEVKEISCLVSLKNKTILDIGAGIGRLSFPLSKIAKKVIALDKDTRLKKLYKKNKPKNLIFIGDSLENYSKKTKIKFDIILVVWAGFNNNFIKHLRKISHKDTIIITITGDRRSENHKLINQLFKKESKTSREIEPQEVVLIKKEKVAVNVTYPSAEDALASIDADLKLWSDKALAGLNRIKILKSIASHEENNKIKFKETAVIKMYKFKSLK